MSTVSIPSFDFSAFYYQTILDALIQYKRTNVPEHTDESEYDPLMQFLRMQALVGHLNNCLLDLVANENTLPTAKLVDSVRNMLRLIDYELLTAAPAQADIVVELSKVFSTSYGLISEDAQFATEREAGKDPVIFERATAMEIARTDRFGYVFGCEGGSYTDYTTKANSQTTPADDWSPFTGAVAMKDAIYFGHDDIMWNQLGLWFTTPMAGTKATGWIQFVAKANLVDGETFVLDDGTNPAVTFHFNVTGGYTPVGGYDATNIEVDVSGDITSDQVATTAKTAINGVGSTLYITGGSITAGKLNLENDNFGIAGNQTITETVADGGFSVSGMSGGTEGIVGIWEYYDGDFEKQAPTGVTDLGGSLEFDLTGYLGSTNRQGTQIRVRFNETTAYQDVESVWSGGKNKVTTGYLGQTSPSTTASDYTVGSDWEEMSGITDGTLMLSQNGQLVYTLPQTLTEDWIAGLINSVTAYWIRYRVITVTGIVDVPVFQYGRLDQGAQYLLASVTQGRTQIEDPLGSSDGTANQRFETSRDYYISGSMVFGVDGEDWTEVDNFLASKPTDKHYTIEIGEDDRATVVCGDGVTGKIPPTGTNNVYAEYRWGANEDGNTGYNTIVVNKSGLSYIKKIWNPRPAAGWDEAQGASETSLEQAKIAGPASIRTGLVALSPSDVEALTISFTDTEGARPFARAKAIEEGFGPKTIELVVVAKGGVDAQASTAQLAALDEYFNGDPYAHPPIDKHLVANQEVTSGNYTKKTINITATVYGDVTVSAIQSRLSAVISPSAVKDDGVTWEWDFGGDVPTSRILHEIFETSENITKVTLTVPSSDVVLSARELPVIGTVAITIVS